MTWWRLAAVVLACGGLIGCGMAPKQGPELSDDQLYSRDAHQWTDRDARTALWWTRNFPDDFAALGFALTQFPIYNRHDERYGPRYRTKTARDSGRKYGSLFHTDPDDVFALIDDPHLRVMMLSLEARERNRMRERERRRHTGTWPYDRATDGAPMRHPDRMDDTEVEQRLLEQYR